MLVLRFSYPHKTVVVAISVYNMSYLARMALFSSPLFKFSYLQKIESFHWSGTLKNFPVDEKLKVWRSDDSGDGQTSLPRNCQSCWEMASRVEKSPVVPRCLENSWFGTCNGQRASEHPEASQEQGAVSSGSRIRLLAVVWLRWYHIDDSMRGVRSNRREIGNLWNNY